MSDGINVPEPPDGVPTVPVASEELTIAGKMQQVQLIAAGHGDKGDFKRTGAENPLPTLDGTPGLVPLSAGGVDAVAGTPITVIGATDGRARLDIQWVLPLNVSPADVTARVWLGFATPAVVGMGTVLEPGQSWTDFTGTSVSALLESAGPLTVRVTSTEWATGDAL